MPRDTTAEAAAVQREVHRNMSGAERLRVAFELSEAARELTLAGLKSRMEDADHEEVLRALVRLCYGLDLPDR